MDTSQFGEASDIKQAEAYQVVRRTWFSRPMSMSSVLNSGIMTLILILISVFAQNNILGLSDLLPASRANVFEQKEFWRLWGTLFVHADLKHLLSNSVLFFILGSFISNYFGLLIFPFFAFLFGGMTNAIVLGQMPLQIYLVGVSGVVYWLGGVWLILYAIIETRRSLTQRIMRSVGVGLLLFMPAEAFDASISYQAHFVGFVLGVGCGFIIYLFKRKAIIQAELVETIVEPTLETFNT